ncbi:hypothetical protein QJQ45_012545 [Haematococcus lacustris]|nr:hypothetical protein QJQ45_012545 [Haematococcus lacustris]
MADNKTLEQAARRKDMEIAELQAHINSVVRDFEARQREVEARAPLLNTRLQEVRDSLTDLRISDAKYAELKSMDPTALGLLDCVKVAAHEATRELAAENERLRLSMASTREAAARSEEEGARLSKQAHVLHRAEAARLATSIVEKEREQQRTTEGLQARVERLASELEAASVRCELLAAKGQMYDELRARTERLQEDNQRLQVIEASFKRLEQQHQELRLVAQQREHGHEMLVTDKAYLSKQAEFLAAAQSRLQNEVEVRDAKIAELQRQKQELFDKLVQTESLKNREGDARLQRELAALQAATHADMERIRVETSEAYEREARLLRELRDAAQEDAARAKKALSDLQAVHESHQMNAAEAHRRLEGTAIELQTELKQKAFELSHFKVVVGEKESLLQRLKMQAELLQDKLQASMDRCRVLEAEAATLTVLQQRAPTPAQQPDDHGSRALAASEAVPGSGGGVSGKGAQELVAQVLTLQRQLGNATQEKEAVIAKLAALDAELARATEQLRLVGQPHSFLLRELSAAQAAKQQMEEQAVAAQNALKVAKRDLTAENDRLTSQCSSLRADLDMLLAQRGQMEGLKALLAAATQPAEPGPGPSTPPPAKRTQDEPEAAEPIEVTGKAKGRAAKAKPAPQPGRWLHRGCNAALNMQRIGESRWRPLELCWWAEQTGLPAKGKEYPGLGYKRLRDQSPKAQQQQQQPAVAE